MSKINVVVTVEGGCLTVMSDSKEVDVHVVDYDIDTIDHSELMKLQDGWALYYTENNYWHKNVKEFLKEVKDEG